MASPARHFKAPFLAKERCWAAADLFRQQHCLGNEIPVDVLALVEFELGLEIRTITGLKEDADVDALLLGDWKTLIVDQQQFLDDRFIHRLRFSIAHELGHFVLHKEVFDRIPRSNADEWIAFMLDMPEREYRMLEMHANEFAGRFLVPLEHLNNQFAAVLEELELNGLNRKQLLDEHISYLCVPLARHFAVSQDMIERRLLKEGLWPLQL
jgi:hypothetical protein